MKILASYTHGSQNSIDNDVVYVVDELPSKEECKKFCEQGNVPWPMTCENRNIIVVESGMVVACYKGTVDEINNSLLATYSLHGQRSELLVKHKIERNLSLKLVRSVRSILSHLSRTQYRSIVKSALNGSWSDRIKVLSTIAEDSEPIQFNENKSKMTYINAKKVIAFQAGQSILLTKGIEVYTKDDISKEFPMASNLLKRVSEGDDELRNVLMEFCEVLKTIKYEEYSYVDAAHAHQNIIKFAHDDYSIDLRNESMIFRACGDDYFCD